MESKKNKILFIVLGIFVVIFLVVLTIVIINFSKNDKNNDTDTDNIVKVENKELTKDKEISNVNFSGIQYYYNKEENLTYISTFVVNNNNKAIRLGEFIVKVYKDNELVGTFNPNIDRVIEKGSNSLIGFSMGYEWTDVNRMEIELPNLEFIEEE